MYIPQCKYKICIGFDIPSTTNISRVGEGIIPYSSDRRAPDLARGVLHQVDFVAFVANETYSHSSNCEVTFKTLLPNQGHLYTLCLRICVFNFISML